LNPTNPECLTSSVHCKFQLDPKTWVQTPVTCIFQGQSVIDYWLPSLQTVYSVASPSTNGGSVSASILFNQINANQMGTIKYNENIISGTFSPADYTAVTLSLPAGSGSFVIGAGLSKKSFQYQAPTITSIVSNNGTTQYQINGNNFYISASVVSLKWNGGAVSTITSVEHQKIIFSYPTQFTENVAIDLSINSTAMASSFQYQVKPAVYYSSSTDHRGGVITLKGARLNTLKRDGSASVVNIMIGSNECTGAANPTAGDYTQMTCTVPSGFGGGYDIVVTIDGIQSDTPYPKYSYVYPVITSYSQQENTMTLNGTLLGATETASITFNGKTITPSSSTSPVNGVSQLSFTLPADASNGNVQVLTGGRLSPPSAIKITPTITSVSPSSTAGSTITITGKYLLITNFISEALPVTFTNSDGFECKNFVQGTDGTTLMCQASAGVGKDLSATLSIDSEVAATTISYQAPSLTTIDKNGSKGIIKGTNFGKNVDKIKLFVGETLQNALSAIDTEIEFNLPTSAIPTPLYISVAEQDSNSIPINFVSALLSFSSVPTQGGLLGISGELFNTSAQKVVVWINQDETATDNYESPKQCTDAVISSSSQIQCQLSSGSGMGHVVSVYIDDIKISNPGTTLFKYASPTIISSTSVNQEGGNITIQGSNFNYPLDIKVGDRVCLNPTVEEFKTIICSLDPFSSVDQVPKGKVPMVVNITSQLVNLDFEYGVSIINNTQSSENSSSDIIVNSSNSNSHGSKDSSTASSNNPDNIENVDQKKSSNKAKWLAPVIILPVVAVAGAFGAAAYFMIRKQKKLGEMKKKSEFSN